MSRGITFAGALPSKARTRGRSIDRIGDGVLYGLCLLASVLAVLAIAAIVYQVVHRAGSAISHFGPGFLAHSVWQPNFGRLGGATFLYGTAVTSIVTLLLAVPIGVAIALYLSMLAPRRLRNVIGPLVEMLAAIPSVILGFWGILVLGTLPQVGRGAVSAQCPRLPADLRSGPDDRHRPVHRQPHPDDHGRPDHRLAESRSLPDGSRGAQGRGHRARGHALGGGPRCGHTLCGVGSYRRQLPRAGSSAWRGDRGHPGHRRRQLHPRLALSARRHARQPDRRPVSGRCNESADCLALLSRPDPAGDRACRERGRPVDRSALRRQQGCRRDDRPSRPAARDDRSRRCPHPSARARSEPSESSRSPILKRRHPTAPTRSRPTSTFSTRCDHPTTCDGDR